MDSVTVGLDIGSSAVRAAEIGVSKDGQKVLRRFAQVGIPAGYVVDNEIRNPPGVAAALRRLWSEGGFSTTDVVVGVAGPRVFVRQADAPALSKDEIRSALRFDTQELVPVAMDDASFDFSLLGDPIPGDNGKSVQRVLLVAAHRELLHGHLDTLKAAGLKPIAMDALPLALMRAVPYVATGQPGKGIEVIVSIGAESTTIGVREAGIPKFIRNLGVGGAKLTEAIANRLHVEMAVAERLKRGSVPSDTPLLAPARKALTTDMRDLAEEVRATIDFFLAQSSGVELERILITGGGSQTDGLAAAIAGNLAAPIMAIDPLAQLDASGLGFSIDEQARVSSISATAVGLALWPTDMPLIRLSVLPDEVLQARRVMRVAVAAGAGIGGLIVLLGFASASQLVSLHKEQSAVRSAQTQASALSASVARMTAATAIHGTVQNRRTLVQTALKGDVDWVRVLGQLAGVMPQNLSLSSFSGSRSNVVGSGPSASSGSSIGTVSVQASGNGGLLTASAFLQGLESDQDLSAPWISGVSVKQNGGAVTFSSTGLLTTKSESSRYLEVGK
ncbi:MAG: type IV pilus assembly protein PilM [Acidobacteriota bacterium]|nr:type IV pilus assembly protein PilM [Acidobacteriota bacterium]